MNYESLWLLKIKIAIIFYALIEIWDKNQKIKILKEVRKMINEECTDEFGTYSMQNIIGFASSEEEFKILLMSFNDLIGLPWFLWINMKLMQYKNWLFIYLKNTECFSILFWKI